jgi:hypothetical protein
MKQTSVEWFNQQLVDRQNGNAYGSDWDEILQRAKEMEKQQIQDAYEQGEEDGYWHPENGYTKKFESAEQYYNETFKSE